MQNKFLEFLLNDKLKDLTYHLRDISSERDKRYSTQLEEYPYIDDFFKFFLELNVSQEDLFNSIRKEKASYSLAQMLFSYETQNDKNRKQKLELFKPLLSNNVNFYKQVMAVFLSDHVYLKNEFKQINKEIFTEIVDIGIEKGFFQFFTEEAKQTQVTDYKEVLIKKGVFDTNYDKSLTIKILSDKNENKISNHFSMYSSEIHDFLTHLTFESYGELKKELVTTHKIVENSEDVESKKLFNKIISNLIAVEKDKFLPLLSNPIIKENILYTDTYGNNAITELIKSPKLLLELLNQTNDYEKTKLYNKEEYTQGIIIKHLTETSRDAFYMDNELLTTILEHIDKYTKDSESNAKEIIITHVLFNQTPKLNNANQANKLFEKYSKSIVKGICAQKRNENYFKYRDKLNKFNEFQKVMDSGIWNKIKSKIEVSQKDSLYKFYQKDKSNYLGYEDKEFIGNLATYIEVTNDITVLNVLNADPKNPEWKNYKFSYNISNKNFNEETIISYLLRSIGKEDIKVGLITWLAQESAENFYDVKLGVKDVLSYYFKESEQSNKNGNQQTIIVKILNKLLESESTFEATLNNNKKLKMIESLNNEELQKKLGYYNLKKKLSNTKTEEHVTPKVKNKI